MKHRERPMLPIIAVFLFFCTLGLTSAEALPDGFVYLDSVIPSVKTEMRYFGDNNFTGRPVAGYLRDRCIMTKEAARALKGVQEDLAPFGLELRVYDAYRPQRAVDDFVRWAADLADTKTKARYYPDVDKKNLFKEGYIAARSSHTRGSTVDLTVVESASGAELDMGSPFDFFGPISWPDSKLVPAEKRAHRLLLRTLMVKHGFNPYAQEWWHFTLAAEPYPETYFDFPIE